MGGGDGKGRHRTAAGPSQRGAEPSDDQPEDESEETPETEEAESVATSVQSKVSQKAIRSLFGKKTKKIIDGKWMECLDPMPVYTSDMKMNEESVVCRVDRG